MQLKSCFKSPHPNPMVVSNLGWNNFRCFIKITMAARTEKSIRKKEVLHAEPSVHILPSIAGALRIYRGSLIALYFDQIYTNMQIYAQYKNSMSTFTGIVFFFQLLDDMV